MINGNVYEFIDELTFQDHYAIYQGQKYYFNGCQCQYDMKGNIISVTLEVYNLTTKEAVFSTTQDSITKCIDAFEKAKIFNGKTFWKAEKDIEWVDC